MAGNDLIFVRRIVDMLGAAGIAVWVYGGWAHELLGRRPWSHVDLDLLYPASDFELLDGLIRKAELDEIAKKRRPFKRAFRLDGIRVELILVKRNERGYYTDFGPRARYYWPGDVLSSAGGFPVAGPAALADQAVRRRARRRRRFVRAMCRRRFSARQ